MSLPAIAPPASAGRQLGTRFALVLQASILLLFLAGSSAPTPLYATYQHEWHFSAITVTVVFGVYAIAVLAALLVVGSLSDHVGRRPIFLIAIAMQIVVMAIFATADGVPMLLAARVLQGLATGSAAGALGAGLVDVSPARGAAANAVSSMAGTASGALGAAVLVQLLPAPTQLVYLVLLAVLALQALGVLLIAETSPRVPGALASLRPRLHAPRHVRPALLVVAPSLVAVWALAGFFGSLGPALAAGVVGSSSAIVGGLALFVLAGAAAVAVYVLRDTEPRRVALLGNAALALGVAIVLIAVAKTSAPTFFLGATIAGIGFGAGFQGALRTVVPLAGDAERAGVISVLYAISYLAMGLPAVLGGVLAVNVGVTLAAREYGFAVIALALLTLAATVARGRRGAEARGAIAPQDGPLRPLACAETTIGG
jgi:predicted MFS family arabinose efflux permease